MTEIMRISPSAEDINALHRAFYDSESSMNVITRYLEIHAADNDASAINSPIFEKYAEKYAEKYSTTELIKDQMTVKYIPAEYASSEYQWSADFSTDELVIYKTV